MRQAAGVAAGCLPDDVAGTLMAAPECERAPRRLGGRPLLRASSVRLILILFALIGLLLAGGPGFRSKRALDEHFAKHGSEFGNITKEQYLGMAQELRDARAGGDILEQIRADGVSTRFDRKRGYFLAFNPDRTIRTFFVPNDGERYFRRQASRPTGDR